MKTREKAYTMLVAICIQQKYSNIVLKNGLHKYDEKDRAFISAIVYGTLQNHLYLKYQWEPFVHTNVKRELAILLDMSVYQLLFMNRVPDFALVDEAVQIAKAKFTQKEANFVNAILRRCIKQGKREVVGDEDTSLAIQCSLPVWLVKMWNKQYGKEVCKLLCFDTLKVPHTALRVNTLKTTKDEILALGYQNGLLAPDAVLFTGGIQNQPAFMHGLVSVQDEASQLVAPFVDPNPHDIILDMCSAPGSKTTHLSACMKNQGKIYALELHEHRAALIEENVERLGCTNVEVSVMDALQVSEVFEHEYFDKVLLDAPCSGYGVMKRKNDIKYHLKSEDMDGIIKMQRALLEASVPVLKSGGILVYSTCTLNKKENELQIEAFLKRNSNFTLVESKTIFPYEYECDGFYMAKLIKQ